jgi:hypothetical protein
MEDLVLRDRRSLVSKIDAHHGRITADKEKLMVPDEEAAVETIKAPEGPSGDQQPAVGCRNPLKRCAEDHAIQGAPKIRRLEKRPWCPDSCCYYCGGNVFYSSAVIVLIL